MKTLLPFDASIKRHLSIAIVFSIWLFIFLYYAEPLGIEMFNNSQKLTYLPLYSLSIFTSYAILLPFQNYFYKKNNAIWYLINEAIFLILFILNTFITTYFIFSNLVFVYKGNISLLSTFIQQFYIPAVLTLFPIIIITRWALGRYSQKKNKHKKIEIKGSGNYDSLHIHFNDLVYVKSSDNYIEVSYLESGILKKAIIRALLTNIEKTFPDLLRTHRSYLINPFHFKQWNSGKNKLEVILKNDISVPVSKTYTKNVTASINSTTKKL